MRDDALSSLRMEVALRQAVEESGMEGFWRWHRDRLLERHQTAWVPAALLAEAHAGAGYVTRAAGLTERYFAFAPFRFITKYFMITRYSFRFIFKL